MNHKSIFLSIALFFVSVTFAWSWSAPNHFGTYDLSDPYDSYSDIPNSPLDTLPPIKDRQGNFVNDPNGNPFDLKDPKVITRDVQYDPKTGMYIVTEKIGDNNYRPPTYMTFDEYLEWRKKEEDENYYKTLYDMNKAVAGDDPVNNYKDRISKSLIDRLFCGSTVDVRPQGNIDLTFGADFQRIANPVLTERQQRQGGFDFDMNIQLNVVGTIGQKLKLQFNYNTQATFDFDRQIKIEYLSDTECSEDDIIKKIEAGNVSFPLRSSLIQGRQNLFGFRADLQFGRLTVSTVVSQSQSRRKELQIEGGAQLQTFEVNADNYDENRHFFISHYNRNNYERALSNMPQINTLFELQKVEVWITNDRNVTEGVRDVVAISDLGETDPNKMVDPNWLSSGTEQGKDLYGQRLPDNDANGIYDDLLNTQGARDLETSISTLQSSLGMTDAEDFSKIRARKLAPSEYTFHPKLGFVSLNVTTKPTDVVAIAYQYTYNGKTYQVGEFAQDLPIDADTLNVMYLKMLKGVRTRVDLPIWDLMMKNVYSLGAYQINSDDFFLDLYYQDPGGGDKRFLPEGPIASRPLLSMLNLDNLNRALDPIPDGQFDFVPGITILPQNGRVIFPVLEPFGSSLEDKFIENDVLNPLSQKYVYNQLYDSTITRAREYPEFNRYLIKGRYKSSVSSEISLGGFNIPKGSVVVAAGGAILVEGTDYQIDYNLGRIKILNEAYLNSGQPIRVTFEDNSTFGFNRQSFIGTRLDYFINEKFNIGGTFLHLMERPFTQKVNYGDDPISNSIYGFDVQYSSEAPWLTKFVDFIPLISTKAKSSVSFTGEFAHLLPGSPNVINQGADIGGVVYLDDFEGSVSNFNLTIPSLNWVLSSTPRNDDNPLFPEASLSNDWDYNKNRAKIAWYQLDPDLVTRPSENVPIDSTRSAYVQLLEQQDVFPNAPQNPQVPQLLRTFDLAYYPKERGPYNFSVENMDPNSGEFTNPTERWGGIMRSIQNNDFEANNIEFVEVWMLSPFKEGKGGNGGYLYIDLGDVSEDILKDSRLFFENGIPDSSANTRTDTTTWSRVPRTQAITRAFDNNPEIRDNQDIGLDGFDNEGERIQYEQYLTDLEAIVGANSATYQRALEDPSSDDFLYFRDESYDLEPPVSPILGRYKRFNNPQGNSSAEPDNANQTISTSTNIPDTEDINKDNTLNEEESYFQYRIPIFPDGVDGEEIAFNQYTTDSVLWEYEGPNGPDAAYWYQLKIPIDQFTDRVGGIQDFRSIRFMRMYMTGFSDETILRFARLDLIRNQWRRYQRSLALPGALLPSENSNTTTFDVSDVNYEENAGRTPFAYVLPPGVQREQALGALPNVQQNEQALALNVCGLEEGDARGVFKNVNFDMRVYDRMKMFVHAESVQGEVENEYGELTMFMRIGSDFESNYYEYEIPLTMSTDGENQTEPDPALVWLPENEFDFPLSLLRQVKIDRDASGSPLNLLYTKTHEQLISGLNINDSGLTDVPNRANNPVSVIGNPDLGLVKSVMIGIRNKKDDGISRCAEVWVNELRLTGFDERGGTAGLARLDLQMADFGNITVSGSYKTIGFGGIEQKVNERSRERHIQYDVAGSFNLDKFFPKKWKLRIPFYAQYAQDISTPEYDPYQLDIPLKDKLRSFTNLGERDSVRRQAETVRTISSFNFTNVRKERTSKFIPLPIDISNFTFTYAQSKNSFRSPIVLNEERTEHRGVIDYTYKIPIKPIYPFKKLFKKKIKWLALIQDFNFQPLPNNIGFRNELVRRFAETTYRFSDPENGTWYDKRFTWDRSYNLQWDLTKSIKFNYTATNNGIIDEPEGRVDTREKRDSLWSNVQRLGRNKHYTHNINLSYNLPFKKIPILDWINVRAQYSATYDWAVASLNTDSLGNVIQNSQNRQINGDFQFTKLYNKLKYFKKLDRPIKPKNKDKNKGDKDKDKGDKDKDKGNKDKDKDKDKGDKDKKKNKNREPSMVERILIRPLLMIRRARITYNEDFTTIVPGFMSTHKYLGLDRTLTKPGWGFIAGLQPLVDSEAGMVPNTWLDRAAQQGWITDNIFQNQQVQQTRNLNYSGKLTLEPYKNFKIDVDLNKNVTENFAENFKMDTIGGSFRHLNPMRMGSVTMTYLPIRTMKDQLGTKGPNSSSTFEQFENNRSIISQRIGTGQHGDQEVNPGYTEGYGRYQQDVLIPAFLAAYTGQDASKVKVGQDIRGLLPMPNWKLTFNGLSKLKAFKKIFSSFSLTHGYKSTLTVNSFVTDLDYQENPTQTDINSNNFYSTFEIPNLVITEQFSPLIGIDMRFKNELSIRFNYKKSRTLSMSFVDYQLSQQSTEDITVGVGHKFKDFKPFKLVPGWKKRTDKRKEKQELRDKNGLGFNFDFGKTIPKNELDLRFDFSYRDDRTVNHILDQEQSVATRGMKTIRISPSIDYIINNRLTIRLFYDYSRTIPAVSNSFPITNSKMGVTVRFSLSQ
ncbi:MAG: cell surface protein SprA [Saprospiraceae bacterium]|nr:cell surface protein SprA [Saprospiraceae bacterium]